MSEVRLEGVWREYPRGVYALQGVDLTVRPGEFLAVVGRGGSGKTTLLRLIAGLDRPTRGRIWLDGQPAEHLPPHRRNVAMVFQSPALYPHLRVFDNLAFALRRFGQGRLGARGLAALFPGLRRRAFDVQERVHTVAETLRLEHLLDRYPAQLSGGERQRAALGRAMVRAPRVFLYDEPLASVDLPLRAQLRCEIKALHGRLGATMLYVTHDQAEALSLGDRVAVLHAGRVQQVAEPEVLCHRPANRWVAELVGTPPMSLITGCLLPRGVFESDRGWQVAVPEAAWRATAVLVSRRVCAGWPVAGVLLGACRVPGVSLVSGPVRGRAVLVEPAAGGALVHMEVGAAAASADRLVVLDRSANVRAGQDLTVWLDWGHVHWFDADSGEALAAASGGREERRVS
ncbi:MAG: ABC transporter ATP-binding protein [Pirellulales bacterium]|nr:ABC transporter ATP-binding protein [Pirellulales bacterium]